MKIRIEIDQRQLIELVRAHIERETNVEPARADIKIQTKSTQNYKSEWESDAGFRAVYEVDR